MSFFIQPSEKFLDKVTNPEGLARRDPYYGGVFDKVKEIRNDYWHLGKQTSNGRIMGGVGGFKHIAAGIPAPLWFLMEELEPGITKDPVKFLAWLGRETNAPYRTTEGKFHGRD